MALVESWSASAEWCLSMIPIMGLVVWRQCADKWQLGCAGSKCRLWLGHREIQVIAVRPSCSSAAARLHYPAMPVLLGADVALITYAISKSLSYLKLLHVRRIGLQGSISNRNVLFPWTKLVRSQGKFLAFGGCCSKYSPTNSWNFLSGWLLSADWWQEACLPAIKSVLYFFLFHQSSTPSELRHANSSELNVEYRSICEPKRIHFPSALFGISFYIFVKWFFPSCKII